MLGAATLTTKMSKSDMKVAVRTTGSAFQRRGSYVGGRTGASMGSRPAATSEASPELGVRAEMGLERVSVI